ncbi:RNF148 protein [Hibiscus syriacus]|uniref:RNF148 protein n=1 Tax=Hibiscus syriacus TaxID=106335 RepID=A0A6A3CWZ7_HIBSY|nr:uncharacterized protein LOC120145896 [Hibiscus syriacus]KAE8731862.1 RNF148 protein [Hibiscus syriacus]
MGSIRPKIFVPLLHVGTPQRIALSQQAFPGVLPYQLVTAAAHLHQDLTSLHPHPLILRWVPDPPSRSQVDIVFRFVTRHRENNRSYGEPIVLGSPKFNEWAHVLFTDAFVGNAGKAVMKQVPVGVLGIAGIGAATRTGKDVVGRRGRGKRLLRLRFVCRAWCRRFSLP